MTTEEAELELEDAKQMDVGRSKRRKLHLSYQTEPFEPRPKSDCLGRPARRKDAISKRSRYASHQDQRMVVPSHCQAIAKTDRDCL